jgi:anti-anti-sigma regulatory factor
MLPEILEDLCIRDDVVAVRFPGERLSAWRLEEANGGKYFPQAVDAVLAVQAKRDARLVVFDIRNVDFIGKSFLGCCVTLWRQFRLVRCQLVVICDEQTSEIFAITNLDKVITVLVSEGELQKLVAASAERAAPADRPRE